MSAPSVATTPDLIDQDDAARRLLHLYLTAPRRPRPGDRALCGRVKPNAASFASDAEAHASGQPYCVVCLDLSP